MSARGVSSKYDKKFDQYMETLSEFVSLMGIPFGLGESKHFKTDSTGLPVHMDMMDNPKYFREKKGIAWKVILMTPEEYERAIYRGFNTESRLRGKERAIPDQYTVREFRIDRSHLEKIKNIMREKKIDMPFLRYDVYRSYLNPGQALEAFSQEGHHRIVAAEELGETHIPVLIEFPSDRKEFDIVRPLITKRIKAEIEGDVGLPASGVISKPYRTRQQRELESLERWERAKRAEADEEFRPTRQQPVLIGEPASQFELDERRRVEKEAQKELTELRMRHPSIEVGVKKTGKKLELEDFL